MLHNWISTGGDGAEIIYSLRNNDTLSRKIANEFENVGQNVRKYYQKRLPSNPAQDYYYLLRNTPNNETLIVEYGFTDSKNDDVNLIKNNWQTLAEAVVKALASYVGVPYSIKKNVSNGNDDNIYIVQKGDSLWSISKKYNMTVNDLMYLNNLSTSLLQVGQKLIVGNDNLNENTYIVKKGDTLWSIANKYNTSVYELKKVNNLSSDLLQVGQVLNLSEANSQYYIVKKGDSLWSIANKYNTTVNNLKIKNNLSTDLLQIGQKLII